MSLQKLFEINTGLAALQTRVARTAMEPAEHALVEIGKLQNEFNTVLIVRLRTLERALLGISKQIGAPTHVSTPQLAAPVDIAPEIEVAPEIAPEIATPAVIVADGTPRVPTVDEARAHKAMLLGLRPEDIPDGPFTIGPDGKVLPIARKPKKGVPAVVAPPAPTDPLDQLADLVG